METKCQGFYLDDQKDSPTFGECEVIDRKPTETDCTRCSCPLEEYI